MEIKMKIINGMFHQFTTLILVLCLASLAYGDIGLLGLAGSVLLLGFCNALIETMTDKIIKNNS
jgi:hypothetical protein